MAANMVVRTNVFSLNAHRNMKNVGLEQRRSSNRLASGYRINSAADDAAGLAISENMRAQIRGLDQASRNAQDGQAMILTTEGGLTEIGNIMIRVRELMVQASNDTNTSDQRQMIEQEIQQLGREVHSMQTRVEFNTNRVLNMGPAATGALNDNLSRMELSNALLQDTANSLADLRLNTQRALDLLSEMSASAETSNLAGAQRAAVLAALQAFDTVTIDADDLAYHVAGFATRDVSVGSGIEYDGSFTIESDAITGHLTVDPSGVPGAPALTDYVPGEVANALIAGGASVAQTGAGSWAMEYEHFGAGATATTVFTWTYTPGAAVDLRDRSGDLGETGLETIGQLRSFLGVRMELISNRETAIANRASQVRATIDANYAMAREHAMAPSGGENVAFFQVGANASQGVFYDFERVARSVTAAGWVVRSIGEAMSSPSTGSGIGMGVDISPFIGMVDSSITDINQVRANLGAVQNRMDFTMRSLDISSENLSDAESRVRNADIAREMMRFTMTNVLQQAAVSMLSQANQLPQNLLQLLR